MKAIHGMGSRTVFVLAALCTGLLVFNMASLPIYKEQVFLERGTITMGGEMAILVGFLLLPVFNIVSLLWVSSRIRQAGAVHIQDVLTLALGVLCLILLLGEKVMLDEIGREYPLGWEVTGEWIILYVFLAVQLLYNAVILRWAYRAVAARRTEAGT